MQSRANIKTFERSADRAGKCPSCGSPATFDLVVLGEPGQARRRIFEVVCRKRFGPCEPTIIPANLSKCDRALEMFAPIQTKAR